MALPHDLPTPCLVVDLDVLDRNLAAMADHARATGLRLRSTQPKDAGSGHCSIRSG
jgi:D-serine deaminase-like pyridoxal phosphate-dependent protein